MTTPERKWTDTAEWYGQAAHLCVGPWCRFHLATIVGAHGQRFLVSTVGEYYRKTGISERDEKLETVGYRHPNNDGFYETMVFPVGDKRCSLADCICGQPETLSFSELAAERYALRGEATQGHMRLCAEWDAKTAADIPKEVAYDL